MDSCRLSAALPASVGAPVASLTSEGDGQALTLSRSPTQKEGSLFSKGVCEGKRPLCRPLTGNEATFAPNDQKAGAGGAQVNTHVGSIVGP